MPNFHERFATQHLAYLMGAVGTLLPEDKIFLARMHNASLAGTLAEISTEEYNRLKDLFDERQSKPSQHMLTRRKQRVVRKRKKARAV